MDGVKQQDSTPQTDSTLGFKWIKKIDNLCSDIFIILIRRLTKLCLNSHFEMVRFRSGMKRYWGENMCANCYLHSNLFLKQEIWSWLVRFECENSAIDVIINFLWKIFHKPIDQPPLIWFVISAGTLHDLRRVKVPGRLWNPWRFKCDLLRRKIKICLICIIGINWLKEKFHRKTRTIR